LEAFRSTLRSNFTDSDRMLRYYNIKVKNDIMQLPNPLETNNIDTDVSEMNSNSMPNFTCVTNQSFECAITHKLLMKSTSRFILSNLSHPISKDITITIYKKHDSKDDIGEQLYQYNSQANIFSNSVHINVTFKESSLHIFACV